MSDTNSFFQYTELICDSTDARFGYNSRFARNDWPRFDFTTKEPNIACIKVLQAEIPFVFDVIDDSNNTLIFILSGTQYLITVPTGTYSESVLASNLQTEIQLISPGFTVTYSSTTRQYTFTISAVASWGLFFNGYNNLFTPLGFLRDTTYTASGAGSTIVSGAASLCGGNYIQINSQTIGPYIECNTTDTAPGGGITPVIARIPINAAQNNLITYTDPCPSLWFDYIGNQFDTFDLYMTLNRYSSDTPIKMKNVNWSVKLGILTYRQDAIKKGAPQIGKTL